MSRDWKLNEEQLQKLLLVRKVIISPLIGQKLEIEDETGESVIERGAQEDAKDSEVHKARRQE